MITSIRMVNFKNFADQTLRLGPFTTIVGANASGKSNIRDAFRFLHGVGRGYTLAEIVGGKWGAGGQREWQPIRGAAKEIARLAPDSPDQSPTFSFHVHVQTDDCPVSYLLEIDFDPESIRYVVAGESVRCRSDGRSWTDIRNDRMEFDQRDTPALTHLNRSHPDPPDAALESAVRTVTQALSSMRFWDLSPELMRLPAHPGTPLGDRGENLPAVLETLCADPHLRSTLVSWLQELTPMDVSDLEFPHDPYDRTYFMLREKNGVTVSAESASDGTLRFLAMLAVLLGKDAPKICFFEEIDVGIHASRQWLLLELIETQAAKRGIQVVSTTHSPEMLTYANDRTFEQVSVVCRTADANDAVIRPVAGLYNARELRKSGELLGSLLSEGWMENAVSFAEHDRFRTTHAAARRSK